MQAQALLERGMIEGLISGLGGLVTHASLVVQDHPWIWVVGGLALALVIRGGFRRSDF